MARPKMTVAAATGRTPEVMRSGSSGASSPKKRTSEDALGWEKAHAATGRGGGLRLKQPVKLSDGRVVHMRVKEEDLSEVEDGAEQCEPEGAPCGVHSCNCEQPVQGVGSRSAEALHQAGEFAPPGSDQYFVSDDDAHDVRDCETPQACRGTQNVRKHEVAADAEFSCTACGHSVGLEEVRAHPVLHVGVCEDCYEFLFSSPFTKDNPLDPSEHENECRWCGDGGEVVLCDTCPKAFCKSCILRNFGPDVLSGIESPTRQWRCYVCDDSLLQALILEYKNIGTVAATMHRNSPARMPSKSREVQQRRRTRRRALPGDTIADIIAREKEFLRNKYPEMNFTGFELKRRRRSHSLQSDSVEQGNPISE